MVKKTHLKKSSILIAAGTLCAATATGIALSVNKSYADENTTGEPKEDIPPPYEIDIPTGKYYYNGDINSDFYIEIMADNKLQVVSPDIEAVFRDSLEPLFTADEDASLNEAIAAGVEDYSGIIDYKSVCFTAMDYNGILIEWAQDENSISGHGFEFTKNNTIKWGLTGETEYSLIIE